MQDFLKVLLTESCFKKLISWKCYLLVKALLTGARSVYSVFGPMAAAKPSSDTMSVNVLWESPISSITSLAKSDHMKKKC